MDEAENMLERARRVEPQYLTVAQVAALFGCSTDTVYGWVRDGKIAYMRLPSGPKKPGAIRIARAALKALECPKEAAQSSSTSRDGEKSTSSGLREVAADLRSRARASKVVPMRPRRTP